MAANHFCQNLSIVEPHENHRSQLNWMTISMENYYFSSDTERDQTEWQWSVWRQDKTEWQSVWRITTSGLVLDKIKLNGKQHEQLLYFSSNTGQDKTEWQSVWKIAISVLTLDKIKQNDNQYGELLFQFWHWTR